jgi:AcrR family transcriptional regulator
MTVTAPERETTRSKILAVALELVAAKGFAATSTRELSERLGFTKAALYYHFRTKDDLLFALVEPVVESLRRLTRDHAGRTGTAARRELLASYAGLVVTHSRLIRLLSQDAAARYSVRVRDAWIQLYDQLVRQLTGRAEPSQAELTRARAALGAIHAALQSSRVDEKDPEIQAAALAAACGALGIPAPRPHQ